MKKRTVCIVHYNTPELTEAAILALRKTGTDWPVVVLDNSDRRPFTKKMKGVKVLNNRNGQIVDFDAELEKRPDKCWDMAKLSNYGSAKHMMSVQALWELVPDGFILLESDALPIQNIEWLWQEEYAACGQVAWLSRRPTHKEADRLLPFLCYLNVPLLKANGAKYYDPDRCWALQPGGRENPKNWYDTGAPVLEDIIKTKPALVVRIYNDLGRYYVHYAGGSWRANDEMTQRAWVQKMRGAWE